jgi:hypothetical protein
MKYIYQKTNVFNITSEIENYKVKIGYNTHTELRKIQNDLKVTQSGLHYYFVNVMSVRRKKEKFQ